ncbi:MAG: hypothetical protein CMN31_14070 [Sandaracinus sp.]|nr:hypothetical protein [Sandaracinus sp.]
MRRLTNTEYRNTLRDLFGSTPADLPTLPDDALREGTFENDALALGPSDVRVQRWEQISMALGAHAVGPARANVLPCDAGEADCARRFVEEFGRRVMRRPLENDERDRYLAFFEEQREAIDFDAAVQLTVAAMLQSPWFQYRIEVEGRGDYEIELDDYEIASRLSYLVWESMPDEALFAAAESGDLSRPGEREDQLRRMLDDPRARDMVRNFHRQWLHTERVLGEEKVPEIAPTWSDATRQAASEEAQRFAESVFFEGTVEDLLLSRAAVVNADLAPLYGVEAPAEGWAPVTLPAEERAGILTRVAFLAGEAHEANGSPILRGLHVMERFLCLPRPTPPADANTTPPMAMEGEGPFTNRQLFEQRTAPDRCQGCHETIDGFGFAFEHYDTAGQFRTTDNGMPVDATGVAYGTGNDGEFDGAIELSERLAESDVVRDCVAEKWFTYAQGRLLESEDTCQLDEIQNAFEAAGGDFVQLLVELVRRPEFAMRRAAEGE